MLREHKILIFLGLGLAAVSYYLWQKNSTTTAPSAGQEEVDAAQESGWTQFF
jgi:predicted transcriptional regulator